MAARAKIAVALEGQPRARVDIASEGSFGPHPQIPLVSSEHGIVVLIDRETSVELVAIMPVQRRTLAIRS